ncbi:MAG: ABC transporter permease [Rickettsiales bacterium]|nr:ABC transporter permease [Rickettsiales bacterium]
MGTITQHIPLYLSLVKREVASKYRGTALGFGWSLLHPLLMLAVYTFVFSVVFKARWPLPEGQPQGQFAVILFTGLMIHALMAETLTSAVSSITGQANYVKKIIFPLPMLPLVPLGAALFHLAFSTLILLGAIYFITGTLHLTALWLPVVMLPFIIAVMGAAWFLAALGVYLRDIGQIIGLVMMAMLFLSPIFFPPEALPESYRPILSLNPLTLIITQAREVMLWGGVPAFKSLAIYGGVSLVFTGLCYAFFKRVRKGFADVL